MRLFPALDKIGGALGEMAPFRELRHSNKGIAISVSCYQSTWLTYHNSWLKTNNSNRRSSGDFSFFLSQLIQVFFIAEK